MRSFFLPTASKLLGLAFVLSLSFSPVYSLGDNPASLSNAALSKLVENALNDEIFQLITEADVQRQLNNIKSKRSISQEQWNELAKKKNLSIEETDYIFSFFGFMNAEDVKSYANLLASLGKKYGVDKLNESDQRRFFETLRIRQDKYITDHNLVEKIFNKSSRSNADMPSECWKCVYDFRACSGGAGSWVISYTPVTQTSTTYNMWNGGISITQITYTTPSRPVINYVKSSYSTSTCEGIYRNCMNSCATP